MTAKEALEFIKKEFIGRFGWDAESCVEEPQTKEAVKALEEALHQVSDTQQNVYSWLGYWRDKIPAEAVKALQDVLGDLKR